MDDLFLCLSRSAFRQRFALKSKGLSYLNQKGFDVIKQHADDFVAQRLAPTESRNAGKQHPMRGHPVFIAQHATATSCRGCLTKWHGIAAHQALNQQEQDYIVSVVMAWLEREIAKREPTTQE
ncbi:MAG: DUF4186 domain-containing protein [Symbiopectobacterium sp.]|uniref:DUF4186 domain-containing protein n=1 Tax=Symbiopectobacterium sp. TaxID=2952789 RepID=UPI003F3C553A